MNALKPLIVGFCFTRSFKTYLFRVYFENLHAGLSPSICIFFSFFTVVLLFAFSVFLFKTLYFIVYIMQLDNESETMRMVSINIESKYLKHHKLIIKHVNR